MQEYEKAVVEWWHTSEHGTVALRPGSGPVSHFSAFANPKALMVAVCAGMMGKTVNFKTTGEAGGHWQNVHITKVN